MCMFHLPGIRIDGSTIMIIVSPNGKINTPDRQGAPGHPRAFPSAVAENVPCFTPRVPMSRSAMLFSSAAFPRRTRTSRQWCGVQVDVERGDDRLVVGVL